MRNPKQIRMTEAPQKTPPTAVKPVSVIILSNIRICFEFRASNFEIGSS